MRPEWRTPVMVIAVASLVVTVGSLLVAILQFGHDISSGPRDRSIPPSITGPIARPPSAPESEQFGLAGPTASPATTEAARVRHQGQITLTRNSKVDLDAPQSDPQWKRTDAYVGELKMFKGTIDFDVGLMLPLESTEANYETCRTTTGYRSGTDADLEVSAGDYFCVRTTGDRFAAIRVVDVGSEEIRIDVTTYDPPDR